MPASSTSAKTISSTKLYEQKSAEKQKQKRTQPWDVFRFVQQSSKFVPLPFASSQSSAKEIVQPGQVLWQPAPDQKSKNQLFQFAVLDDVVMGGSSSSTVDNSSGLWKGMVTDANNGGFVGIRSTPNVQFDMTACRGLEWTFAASANMPRRVKVVLRDSTDFNGIAWTTSVDIPAAGKNKQVAVKVPLKKSGPFSSTQPLVPTRFAKIVKDDSTKNGIDLSGITCFQLVYSKFEYEGALNPKFQVGDFDLQLLQVKAY